MTAAAAKPQSSSKKTTTSLIVAIATLAAAQGYILVRDPAKVDSVVVEDTDLHYPTSPLAVGDLACLELSSDIKSPQWQVDPPTAIKKCEEDHTLHISTATTGRYVIFAAGTKDGKLKTWKVAVQVGPAKPNPEPNPDDPVPEPKPDIPTPGGPLDQWTKTNLKLVNLPEAEKKTAALIYASAIQAVAEEGWPAADEVVLRYKQAVEGAQVPDPSAWAAFFNALADELASRKLDTAEKNNEALRAIAQGLRS